LPAPVARVRWAVGEAPTSGQRFIKASGHSQETYFTGKPESAHVFTFMGEKCPPNIVSEYAQNYKAVGFSQDAVLAGHQEKMAGVPVDRAREQYVEEDAV